MVPEVQIQDQAYKLLRRRVSLVLGQWSPIKYGEMNTDALFQIFQHLLNREDPLNDLVVRITAGRQLRNVLEPYEFASAHFMPYAQSTLGNLMALVQEVELSETKMGLLETVRVVVVKMEHHVSLMDAAILEDDINETADCSFRRSDSLAAPATLGRVGRRTPDEAGNFESSLGLDPFAEAGIRAVSSAHPSLDSKLRTPRFSESFHALSVPFIDSQFPGNLGVPLG